jgi:hypothetical protein
MLMTIWIGYWCRFEPYPTCIVSYIHHYTSSKLIAESVPTNLSFEIDDLEEPWTFTKPFTYIHSRMMMLSFYDWPKFFQQSFT